jgi:hypothetical protein
LKFEEDTAMKDVNDAMFSDGGKVAKRVAVTATAAATVSALVTRPVAVSVLPAPIVVVGLSASTVAIGVGLAGYGLYRLLDDWFD